MCLALGKCLHVGLNSQACLPVILVCDRFRSSGYSPHRAFIHRLFLLFLVPASQVQVQFTSYSINIGCAIRVPKIPDLECTIYLQLDFPKLKSGCVGAPMRKWGNGILPLVPPMHH